MQGKLSAAIKFLDKQASSGVLPLSREVISELKEKHSRAREATSGSLLFGPVFEMPVGPSIKLMSVKSWQPHSEPRDQLARLEWMLMCSVGCYAQRTLVRKLKVLEKRWPYYARTCLLSSMTPL